MGAFYLKIKGEIAHMGKHILPVKLHVVPNNLFAFFLFRKGGEGDGGSLGRELQIVVNNIFELFLFREEVVRYGMGRGEEGGGGGVSKMI